MKNIITMPLYLTSRLQLCLPESFFWGYRETFRYESRMLESVGGDGACVISIIQAA